MTSLKKLGFALSLTMALAAATAMSAQAEEHHGHPGGHGGTHHGGTMPHGHNMGPGHGMQGHGFNRGGRGYQHGRGFAGRGHYRFQHRDYSHFSAHERAMWRGGRWHHGWHDGRNGWWWDVGGLWYFYAAPIYPYPLVVSDFYWSAPVMAPAYAPGYWYWCPTYGAYYPTVASCSVPWVPVPPTP
jgi:hypothetical protein